MSISLLNGPLSGAGAESATSLAALRKGLDQAEVDGQGAIQLIQGAGDVAHARVESPDGKGQVINTYA